jgi:hypothetical protein
MPRKPKPRGIFQLPFAAFLLRACACGNFFEQKIQLAGAEQIEDTQTGGRLHRRSQRRRVAYPTFAQRYAELAVAMKKVLACARQANQTDDRRSEKF